MAALNGRPHTATRPEETVTKPFTFMLNGGDPTDRMAAVTQSFSSIRLTTRSPSGRGRPLEFTKAYEPESTSAFYPPVIVNDS